MREYNIAYKVLARNSEGRRQLGISRHRWEDNIKMDLIEVGWEDVDWSYLFLDSDQCLVLVNTLMKFRVLYHARNILKLTRHVAPRGVVRNT
jgi:hypothetical protein